MLFKLTMSAVFNVFTEVFPLKFFEKFTPPLMFVFEDGSLYPGAICPSSLWLLISRSRSLCKDAAPAIFNSKRSSDEKN